MTTSDGQRPAGFAVTLATIRQSLLLDGRWDDVLRWPPDVFAFVDRVLDASEIYRFTVSPRPGTVATLPLPEEIIAAATAWLEWLDSTAPRPGAIEEWWATITTGIDTPLASLADGDDAALCSGLLALHSAADEACAGTGVATEAAAGPGRRFRALARELLTETGSLARVPTEIARVVPRCRTGRGGISVRSLAHHVAITTPAVALAWHRVLVKPVRVSATDARSNVLLLPWPLHVNADDFRAVPFTLPQMAPSEGFFEFAPTPGLDVDLVDRVLAASEVAGHPVDIVVLPECAVLPEERAPLEAVLTRHGVSVLIAGMRTAADGELGTNSVHIGVRQQMIWRHVAQHKHHRWKLDERQVRQYALADALDPERHWWEAIIVPRRSLQVIDVGAGVTLAPLVCEDLARAEPVSDVVRAVAPSFVITLLLDGPQLASRWTARYASVLADDPGCAVCTVSSYGMVRRSQPPGCEPSSVVALWKDTTGRLTEIALDDGAHGVLLSCRLTTASTTTADGRRHHNAVELELLEHRSITGAPAGRAPYDTASPDDLGTTLPRLSEPELSKATSWIEALAEAAVTAPEAATVALSEALDDTARLALGLPRPTRLFCDSVAAIRSELDGPVTVASLLDATARLGAAPDHASQLAASLVRLALAQRVVSDLRSGRLPPGLTDAVIAVLAAVG